MGTLFGFINFIANLGAFLFTFLFGWVKDKTGGFGWAFGILFALCLFFFSLGRCVAYGKKASDGNVGKGPKG